MNRILTPAQVEQYHEEGYLIVEGVVDDVTRQRMKNALAELVEKSRAVSAHDDIYDLEPGHTAEEPRVRRIKKPHLVNPVFNEFLYSAKFKAITQDLLGESVRLHGSKLNPKAPHFGSPVEWHQDWAFYPHTNDDIVTALLFLDDIDETNGALTVVPGSHRGPMHSLFDGERFLQWLHGARDPVSQLMDAIVAEREANGRFASLEELFRRVPPGSMNRRQLEGLAGAGAFDALEPNRAKVLANADMLLAVADEAERTRSSGQAGLFGGEDHAAPSLRLTETPAWPRAEQMAKERENFGFYFAAHPVEQWRAVATANGARTYAALMETGVPGGGRMQAMMAAMVESVSKGRTRRGGEFVRADFSDSSGQFSAACFEESLVEPMQGWAKDGTCLLLTVELDAPSPDEPPRVTVRGARPLEEVKGSAQMQLQLDVLVPGAMQDLATLLGPDGAGTGEVLVRLRTGMGQEPLLRLGRQFHLDSEVAERLASVEGLANVALTARRSAGHLRLVA